MTPDNAGQNVLADLDRLIAKATPRCAYCRGETGITNLEMEYGGEVYQEHKRVCEPSSDAREAHERLASDHLRPLLAALERTAFWRLLADGSPCWCALNDMEPDDEHLPACAEAREALAALQRDIAKALGE